jgi:hypothetical protein
MNILEEANEITHGPRREAYGHPLDNFQHTAGLVNALLGHKFKEPLTANDVVAILRMVKESRQVNAPKRDNLVDIAGYAWVDQEITEEAARRGLDAVSDDAVWSAVPEGTPVAVDVSRTPNLWPAQQQANTVAAQWPDNAGAGAPVLVPGRLQLACGCYGMCTSVHAPVVPKETTERVTGALPALGYGYGEPRLFGGVLNKGPQGPRDPSGKPYKALDSGDNDYASGNYAAIDSRP